MTNPWERDEVVEAAVRALHDGCDEPDCRDYGMNWWHGPEVHSVLAAVGPMLATEPTKWSDVDKATVTAMEYIHRAGGRALIDCYDLPADWNAALRGDFGPIATYRGIDGNWHRVVAE